MELTTILSICLIAFFILGFFYKKIGTIGMILTASVFMVTEDWPLLFNIGLVLLYIPNLVFVFPSLESVFYRNFLKFQIGTWVSVLGLILCIYSVM